jgi:hypothetical protein
MQSLLKPMREQAHFLPSGQAGQLITFPSQGTQIANFMADAVNFFSRNL